jgi:hypothetical protein
MDFGSGKQTYNDRNSIKINLGEELFLDWAAEKCSFVTRLGFDEKAGFVEKFFEINPLLRNIPDFLIINNDKLFLVNVKGTDNIKQKEMDLLPKLIETYSSENAPLVYCFCFRNQKPLFLTTTQLTELYDQESDNKWDDGIVYRKIKI